MNDETKTHGELVTSETETLEVRAIGELLRGVTDPLARSQEVAQQEETKRAEILSKVAHKMIFYIFFVAVLVLLLAGVALWKGEIQLTEKVVFGLLGFLGGFGFGRGVGRS